MWLNTRLERRTAGFDNSEDGMEVARGGMTFGSARTILTFVRVACPLEPKTLQVSRRLRVSQRRRRTRLAAQPVLFPIRLLLKSLPMEPQRLHGNCPRRVPKVVRELGEVKVRHGLRRGGGRILRGHRAGVVDRHARGCRRVLSGAHVVRSCAGVQIQRIGRASRPRRTHHTARGGDGGGL